MRALVWIIEDTWQATIDDANAFLPGDADITLLHVASTEPETIAFAARRGLLGRHPPPPAEPLREISEQAAKELLAAAQTRLRPPSHTPGPPRTGRTRGRGRRRRHGHPRPSPRRRPRAARTAQPRPRDALRHRPRTLPSAADLARHRARTDNNPAAATLRDASASLPAARLTRATMG